MAVGKVYLVGAGPGDPGLLTVKGRDCIACADAIVYDRLLSPRLLTYAKPEATCIYVGKAASDHELSQPDIQALLIRLAADGKRVVRLKGGDPYVFGRGAEEAVALSAAGIPWELVPGVTSAVSVPAYAGIPVTHRDLAPAFTVVTGHRYRTGEDMDAHWRVMETAEGTLVILMGVGQLPDIVERLCAVGRPAETPVALVRWGTRAQQRTLTGQLTNIVARAEAEQFKSPAVIVVGEAVSLRDHLNWYERLPYLGLRGLVLCDTRADGAAAVADLANLGVESLDLSVEAMVHSTRIEHGLDDFLALINRGSESAQTPCLVSLWFATQTGVARFLEGISHHHLDTRDLHAVLIGAADQAIATALHRCGLWSDWIGAMTGGPETTDIWAESVSPFGHPANSATVHSVHLYDSSEPPGASEAFRRWIQEGIDFVWVTSAPAYRLAGQFGLCPDPDDTPDRVAWFASLDVVGTLPESVIVSDSAADVCRETARSDQVVVP